MGQTVKWRKAWGFYKEFSKPRLWYLESPGMQESYLKCFLTFEFVCRFCTIGFILSMDGYRWSLWNSADIVVTQVCHVSLGLENCNLIISHASQFQSGWLVFYQRGTLCRGGAHWFVGGTSFLTCLCLVFWGAFWLGRKLCWITSCSWSMPMFHSFIWINSVLPIFHLTKILKKSRRSLVWYLDNPLLPQLKWSLPCRCVDWRWEMAWWIESNRRMGPRK